MHGGNLKLIVRRSKRVCVQSSGHITPTESVHFDAVRKIKNSKCKIN
jgi:hypothetical protein